MTVEPVSCIPNPGICPPLSREAPSQWLLLLILALGWLAPTAFFVYSSRFLYGFDAYFHVQLAQVMSQQGIFIKEFPWATESIWLDAWFDKEWLFHVALIPFLAFGKTAGAQLFIIFSNILIILSLWCMCRTLKLSGRAAVVWLLLLPWCCWGIFWVRLVLCRPHLLSIAILFLALAAMLRRKHLLLGLASLLYALSYTGHWQLLGLVFIYDLLYAGYDEQARPRPKLYRGWPMLAAAAAGMLIGELIHPNFPANIKGLYIQNVLVLFEAWSGKQTGFRPRELAPAGWQIFWLCAPVFVGFVLMLGRLAWRRPRLNRQIYLLAIFSAGYLLLSVKSFRFLEYFVPVAVLFLAAFFAANPFRELFTWKPSLTRPVLAVCALLVLVFGLHGYRHYYEDYAIEDKRKQDNTHRYAGAAAWLREHLEPGEIVFSTFWSGNTLLWYQAPAQRYLVFLDPIFMRRKSKKHFDLWRQIRHGRHGNPAQTVKDVFHSRVVFLVGRHGALAQQLERAGYRRVYEGKVGERVYLLAAEPLDSP